MREIDSPSLGNTSIAVSCLLTNSDVQRLRLSKSIPYNSGYLFDEIDQATIRLYENGEVVGRFIKEGYGEWVLKYHPTCGKEYRLVVEIPGNAPLSATTIMPEFAHMYECGTQDKNHTKLFDQGEMVTPVWFFCLNSSLTGVDYFMHHPKPADDPNPSLLQQLGTDHKNADRFNQELSASDFDKRYGNTPGYKYYVRLIPDKDIKDDNPYRFKVQHPFRDATFIIYRSVSNEYDAYLKSIIAKMTYYESEDDPAQWFDESVIYSNIDNGVGIFGAYYETSFYYENTFIEPPLP